MLHAMKKRGLLLIAAFMLGLTVLSAGIHTAAAMDPLCDTGLFDQMTERARLQSQRRTAVEQNLIYKPDSILEYTCFERFLDVMPGNITYSLTATPLNDLIKTPVEEYLNDNFSHSYLGGRAPAGLTVGAASATAYTCDAMSVVWDAARCMNFGPEEPEDSYYDLSSFMSAPEIRRYPNICNAPTTVAFGVVPTTATLIAFTAATNPTTPSTDCGLPIDTGNVIDISVGPGETRPQVFNEKLCPNPTCTYMPATLNTGSCVP
jgi:hypothetical protein